MVKFFITYVVPSITLFPIIAFLVGKKPGSTALRVMFAYLVIALILNVTGITMASFGYRNLWLFHMYTAVETGMLLYFFTQIIQERRVKAVLWIFLVAFPLACIINLLFFQHASAFNSYTRSIESVLIIAAAAYYWLNSSKQTLNVPWSDNPLNWIISGLLLYFSSSLFLFLFSNFLLPGQGKTPRYVWDVLWGIHGLLVVIMYILIGTGFIKSKHAR